MTSNPPNQSASRNQAILYLGDHIEGQSFNSSIYHVPGSINENSQSRQASQLVHQNGINPQIISRMNQSNEYVMEQ